MAWSDEDIPELLQRRQDLLLKIADAEQAGGSGAAEDLARHREDLEELEAVLMRLGAQFEN